MKRILSLVVLTLTGLTLMAAPTNNKDKYAVSEQQARTVAYNFVNGNTVAHERTGEDLKTTTIEVAEVIYTGNQTAFYVFQLQPEGFVIVSANRRAEPILGYSLDNPFRNKAMDSIPAHVQGWLNGYADQIVAAIEHDIAPDNETNYRWQRLAEGPLTDPVHSTAVGPLLTTQWGQYWPYNAMCPGDSLTGVRCPAGCVATAFAQIMNYWQYPERGWGEYAGIRYNEQSYQWNIMDTAHVEEISKLFYHVGLASDMSYDYYSSGAELIRGKYGLVTNFEYEYYEEESRLSYTDDSWKSLLDSLLNDSIPIAYGGFSDSYGGHAWVCDGYDAIGLYHMNWGWDGDMNGYFNVDSSMTGYTSNQIIDYVTIGQYPFVCVFTQYPDQNDPTVIQFIDQSFQFPNTYFWDFGDGDTSTQINPRHDYASSGDYLVTHIVCKNGECDTLTNIVTVFNYSFVWDGDTLLPHDGLSKPLVLDYDMDGKQDFIISSTNNGWGTTGTIIYRNVESTFEASPLQHESSLPPFVIDVYNENAPSVLLDGLYLRNVNGTLAVDSLSTLQKVMRSGNRFCVVDYNNDGRMDVMIGDTIYKNIGGGLFKPAYSLPFGKIWLDYDKDGDLDLFTSQGIKSSIYRNNGDGTFSLQPYDGEWLYRWQGVDSISGSWFDASDYGDIDGDGWMDIVGGTTVWNRGNNRFEMDFTIGGDVCLDYNFEGTMDIMHASGFGIKLYENGESTIDLTLYPNFATYGNTPASLAFIDRDGDNRPDLLATGYCQYDGFGGFSTIVYNNGSDLTNNPPSQPTGLTSTVTGNDVLLSWMPSTDDHNSVAITYNIAVGTTPNSCDVFSPLSDLTTGKRYAYNKGNAGNATFWKVNDLSNGTYYWRVQAIDNAMAASAFSSVGIFVVNHENLPPAMANITKYGYINDDVFFSYDEFNDNYHDPEHDTLQSIKICGLPESGVLQLSGSNVTVGQVIHMSDFNSLSFASFMPGTYIIDILPYDGYHFSNDTTHIYISIDAFEQKYYLTAENITALAWGDFDNDGDADLATNTGVWRNDTGTFVQIFSSPEAATSVQWVDVNNDGLLDCLFDMTICINQGSNTFLAQPTLTNSANMKTAIMDLNSDNRPDVVVAKEWNSTVYLNSANGFNTDSVQTWANPDPIGSISIGDYDRDGDEDVIMVENNTWNVRLFGNMDGTLVNASTQITNYSCGSSDWGDYDRDGDLDFIGTTDNVGVKIYSNDGMGNFYEVFIGQFPIIYDGFVKWYDYDNDGYLDILMSGLVSENNPAVYLFRNNHGLGFIKEDNVNLPVLFHPYCAIGDFDSDGYGDVAISGKDAAGESQLFIFRNSNGNISGSPIQSLSTPQNPTSSVSGSTVSLSWNDTLQGGTYNVYIRKATDSSYIVSPLADIQTGSRYVSKVGNAGILKSIKIHSLPQGSYLWSVQRVDEAYHGGAFAQEQSFNILCDEVVYSDLYDTAHNIYHWNQDYYCSSGVYSKYYESSTGCDSIARLHLTIDHLEKGIVYVTQNGAGDKSGYTWYDAMDDLQAAIVIAMERNAVVWVAEGSYTNSDGDGVAFVIPNWADVYIYGGFEGTEPASFDLSQRDLKQHETILDGLNRKIVLYRILGVNKTIVDGLTIQNGNGGGILINTGGMAMAIPFIAKNCIIRNNYGGGFIGGAGNNPEAFAINCLIENNRAWGEAGVSSITLINSTVVNNVADYDNGFGHAECYNSIIWGNIPSEGTYYSSSAYSSAIQFELIGNIDSDCFYLDANNDGQDPNAHYVRFLDPANGDYRLMSSSACVNAGTQDTSNLKLPSVDLQGFPRVLYGRIDMGAYEHYSVPVVNNHDTICAGGSVVFHDSVYSVSGTYTHHISSSPMEDTIYTLHLIVDTPMHTATTETACETFTWQGTSYSTSGDYTYAHTDNYGCLQVDTLHLTINNPVNLTTTETVCGSYTWNGTTYTTSDDYYYSHTDYNGCTQVDTLHLTVNYGVTTTEAVTACDSWQGYIADTIITTTVTAANGCDSTHTLTLTVNHSVATTEDVTACDSWQGYIVDTVITTTTTAANGCDSIVTMNLTINHSDFITETVVACDSYTWEGIDHTHSCSFSYGSFNSMGCDSVFVLYIIINYGTFNIDTVSTCDSYTWQGTDYYENGIYTYDYNNDDGCASSDTLYLTINHSVETTVTDTAENSYLWHDNTYTESGIYHWLGTTTEGCDSTVTLNLTIVTSQEGIGDPVTEDFRIAVSDGRILVSQSEDTPREVRVYDMVGRQYPTFTTPRSPFTLPNGVYLVKVGDAPARRVVVIR